MNSHGMNWIRPEKRLAIYIRDGLACAYCGHGVEDSAKLTLDHVVPRSQGGSNETQNLITACHRCNTERKDTPILDWLGRHDIETKAKLFDALIQPIGVSYARDLIAKRGGFTAAVYG
jgi:5-methylcytosine-specific restriction endonuclease McrA